MEAELCQSLLKELACQTSLLVSVLLVVHLASEVVFGPEVRWDSVVLERTVQVVVVRTHLEVDHNPYRSLVVVDQSLDCILALRLAVLGNHVVHLVLRIEVGIVVVLAGSRMEGIEEEVGIDFEVVAKVEEVAGTEEVAQTMRCQLCSKDVS